MFHLSDYCTIEVRNSQFNPDKYLQVKNNNGRSINLSLSSWRKLKSWTSDITRAMDEEQSYKADFYNTWAGSQAAIVQKYEDKMYFGIHYFDKDGSRSSGKGLNITDAEWKKWDELSSQIDQACIFFPEKWQYQAETKRPIFQWVWRCDGEVKKEGGWTFLLEACYKDGMQQPGLAPEGFTMREHEVTLPPAQQLLQLCYSYLIQKTAKTLIQCNGCEINHPSQKHHLDGCLMSLEGAALLHEQEARQRWMHGK